MRCTVEAAGRIGAPAWAVWAMIGGFDLGWHPDVARCRVDGAVRHLRMADGTEVSERLRYRSETQGRLEYGIDGSDYRAAIEILPDGVATRIVWRANPEVGAAEPVRGLLERGLAALAARLEIAPERFGPGGRIAGIAAGAGPLAIMLHGIGGTGDNWRAQLWALAPTHRALALDLQGYGASKQTDGPMTLAGLMADIELVRQAAGGGPAHLIGLSFGAWLAASYACSHPDRVASLSCAGGFLGMTETPAAARAQFLALRQAPLDQGETPATLAPAIWARLRGPQAGTEVGDAFAASMRAIPAAAYRKALGCFTNPPFSLALTRLTMPVLAVTGEHDALATPTEIGGVAERIRAAGLCPHLRHEVIDGAGHLCNLEKPQAFNRVLTEFLAGSRAS